MKGQLRCKTKLKEVSVFDIDHKSNIESNLQPMLRGYSIPC